MTESHNIFEQLLGPRCDSLFFGRGDGFAPEDCEGRQVFRWLVGHSFEEQ
jgi:hypothetical protein